MAKHAQSQEARRTMMLNEPISRVIPKMAVPTIVAFLINSIYSLADTYFVSNLGTNATAAVSVNASLDQLIMMCGSMVAMGANSYIARLLGEGDEKKASKVLSTSFFAAFFLGVMLLIFGNEQGVGLKMVTDKEQGSSYGFAVGKGINTELLEMFDAGLANLKENGKYQEILDKYIQE